MNKEIQSLYRELLSMINHLITNDRRSHSRIWSHSFAFYLFLFFLAHSQPWASSWSSWPLKFCRGFCWQISHLTVERHFPKCLAPGLPRFSFPSTHFAWRSGKRAAELEIFHREFLTVQLHRAIKPILWFAFSILEPNSQDFAKHTKHSRVTFYRDWFMRLKSSFRRGERVVKQQYISRFNAG